MLGRQSIHRHTGTLLEISSRRKLQEIATSESASDTVPCKFSEAENKKQDFPGVKAGSNYWY